jgi:hypothetical protein
MLNMGVGWGFNFNDEDDSMSMMKRIEWFIVSKMSVRMNVFWFWMRDCLIKDVKSSWRSWRINEVGLKDSLWECRDRFEELDEKYRENEDDVVCVDMVVWIDEGIGLKEV